MPVDPIGSQEPGAAPRPEAASSAARIVARPTYPLRPTGVAFIGLGVILVVLSLASPLDCSLFTLFCVVGLAYPGTILGVALLVAGFPILWYHRPPDPTQVAGQPRELVCAHCGATNALPSGGFCFECDAPLPIPY